MPKLKGFSNSLWTTKYCVVNVGQLEVLASSGITEITPEILVQNLLVRNKKSLIKVLAE